ncbi:MAG: cytochrome P460 family protein [Nannocystaceae bacterium]
MAARPRLGAALAVTLLVTGCQRDRGAGEAFLNRLDSEDYRSAYRRAPGWETARQPTRDSPHGNYLDIYLNSVMEAAIEDGVPLEHWPEGSVIVVDAWSTPGAPNPEFLLVMEKQGRGEGWYWLEWRGADHDLVFAEESVAQCVRCHESGEDQVRSFGLPPL